MTIAPSPKTFMKTKEPEKKKKDQTSTVQVESRRSRVDFNDKSFRDFLKKAPTGHEAETGSRWKLKGNKVVITVQLDPYMLEQLDELAESLGQSRPAIIRSLIGQALSKTNV